ncbi:GTP-binding protein Di-Ras2 [Orchesella cincta]|uniref:GTP-binding protein Di-Ras2 n=1 Tax=Orchesella cincta TaxID=48709 RepID=A0A1D2M2G1_ORCCI|nr:GTP-binding protein Di-Ras2 [Orchesella cincta]
MGDYERVRLVTLGGPGVGKSSIWIFLTRLGPQFPAMRRLSIATAHAFLIVYSLGNRESFELAKVFFDEIQEQRGDFQETPIA